MPQTRTLEHLYREIIGTQLWTASVFTTALFLCVALAFCQEARMAITNEAGEFTTDTGVTITVTREGEPLAGAVLTFTPSEPRTVESDDVALSNVRGSLPESADTVPGFRQAMLPEDFAEEQARRLAIAVRYDAPRVVLRGRVLLPDGSPAARYYVQVQSVPFLFHETMPEMFARVPPGRSVTPMRIQGGGETEADGTFEISPEHTNLLPGTNTVVTVFDRFGRARNGNRFLSQPIVFVASEDMEPLEITLEEGIPVRGRFMSDLGDDIFEPAADRRLRFEQQVEPILGADIPEMRMMLHSTIQRERDRTRDTGEYEVFLLPGEYLFYEEVPLRGRRTLQNLTIAETDTEKRLDLIIPAPITVIPELQDGSPLQSLRYQFVNEHDTLTGSLFGRDGSFRLESRRINTPLGYGTLFIADPVSRQGVIESIIPAMAGKTQRFKLRPMATVTATLVDAEGKPMTVASTDFVPAFGGPAGLLVFHNGRVGYSDFVPIDSEGKVVWHIPHGKFFVKLRFLNTILPDAPGWEIDVASGDTVDLGVIQIGNPREPLAGAVLTFTLGEPRTSESDDVALSNVRGSLEDVQTSLKSFLDPLLGDRNRVIPGMRSYRVDKRIADFPADKFDLSTPEAAYASQKNLIVSNREDKIELLSHMQVGRSPIAARERRELSEEVSETFAKTYREQFVVLEVFILNDEFAFVFGKRLFDDLYDGNFFIKEDGEWFNTGNDQSRFADEIARTARRNFHSFHARPHPSHLEVLVLRDPAATTENANMATLTGRISSGGTPLAGAVITFTPQDGVPVPGTVTTNRDGEFPLVLDNRHTATFEGTVTMDGQPIDWAPIRITAKDNAKVVVGSLGGGSGNLSISRPHAVNLTHVRANQNGRFTLTQTPVVAGETVELDLTIQRPFGAITVGQEATYTIEITNTGTIAAEDVEIVMSLGGHLEPIAVAGREAHYGNGQIFFEKIPTIFPSQSVLMSVNVVAKEKGRAFDFTANGEAKNVGIAAISVEATRSAPGGTVRVGTTVIAQIIDRDATEIPVPRLEVELIGPDEMQRNAPSPVDYRLIIRNVGNGIAERVQGEVQIGAHSQTMTIAEQLFPGQEQEFYIPLFADRNQEQIDIAIVVTGGNGLRNEVRRSIRVVRSDMVPFSTPEGGFTHLVLFTGTGDFEPRTPQRLLHRLNTVLRNTRVATGFFRTWAEDNRLIGGICTDDVVGLRNVIELIPDLEVISAEPLTEQSFQQHAEKQQESLPEAEWRAMKDFENDAQPLPSGLLQAIQEKRRAIQSAEYTVRWLTQNPDSTETRRATFRFQGNDQWFADVSEIMQGSVFQTGCDGNIEWSFFIGSGGEIHYTTRNLADIQEIFLSFLDPLLLLDAQGESLEETITRQGIRYFGEEEIEGIKRHIFGREIRQDSARLTSTTRTEIALNAETLLPETVRAQHDSTFMFGNESRSNTMRTILIFDLVSTNTELPDTAFLPSRAEGAVPVMKERPDEGYDRFFVHINDGAGGRMSVRAGGQRGPRGTMSGGLN